MYNIVHKGFLKVINTEYIWLIQGTSLSQVPATSIILPEKLV